MFSLFLSGSCGSIQGGVPGCEFSFGDTYVSEEEDTCMSYEEEDTCMRVQLRRHLCK
jgi:hypothetical protein